LHATDAAITAALGAGPDTMMLGFDTNAAKARLEAVPWIRHAQVMRLLPSTLQVVVEERTPYAVWQNKGQTYVIDAEGVVLAPALREAYAGLPLVVGEGAGKSAAQLFDQLTPFGDVTKDVIAAIRVGDRRWTLKLASGLEIMLPDDNIAEALTSLAKLDEEHGVLKRDIAAVDLRLLDRVTVRLRETASANQPGGPAEADIPTASTKVAPAKGKT
jgi:cell division protein FtsQ